MSTMHETHSATAHAADVPPQPNASAGRASRPRLTWTQRFTNNWPVVPMRLFLGALFLFAAYAKFNYPGFFGSSSQVGLKHLVDAARPGSPIDSALGPVSRNASLFGHIAAGAEIAIGAGLVLGFFARIAALGGIAYTTIIVLSIHWNSVRQYTGSEGWFTSVDLAVAVALTTFVLGGAGPLSIDRLFSYLRARRDAADDAEPSFYDSDTADSRRRLSPPDAYPTPTAYPAEPSYPVGVGAAGPGVVSSATVSAPYPPQAEYPTTAIGYPVTPPTYPPATPSFAVQRPESPPANWSDQRGHEAATEHLAPVDAANDSGSDGAEAMSRAAEPTSVGAEPARSGSHAESPKPAGADDQPTVVTQHYPNPADLDHDETGELDPDPRGDVAEAGLSHTDRTESGRSL